MEKPYVVGIDIGGTNTVFGVVDARGTILYSGSIKTGKYADVNDYVAELAKGLKSVIDQAGGPDKIKGVGVGAPNGNFFNGCIEFAPNLPWKGKIPLAQLISEQIDGIPVALTNDANAAAIGEMTYGAARGMKDFIVITLGTGVGSGIVIGGNLVYGHDGFAGELGHVIMRRNNGRRSEPTKAFDSNRWLHVNLRTLCNEYALGTPLSLATLDSSPQRGEPKK